MWVSTKAQLVVFGQDVPLCEGGCSAFTFATNASTWLTSTLVTLSVTTWVSTKAKVVVLGQDVLLREGIKAMDARSL
jgi:hypothetical protein